MMVVGWMLLTGDGTFAEVYVATGSLTLRRSDTVGAFVIQ
jgi:hypothetical protein